MSAIEKLISQAKQGRFGDNWLGVAGTAEYELVAMKARVADLEWEEAVINALVLNFGLNNINVANPRRAVADLISIEVKMALDPQISAEAKSLIEKHTAIAQARIAALEEALRRIADKSSEWEAGPDDKVPWWNLGDIARAALEGKQ